MMILRQHVSYLSRISASERLTERDDAKDSRVRSRSFENGLEIPLESSSQTAATHTKPESGNR